MPNKEEIKHYEEKLEAEREKVTEEMHQASTPENFGDDVDPDEETDEAEGFANATAAAQSLKDRVNEIEEALARIHDGTYGVCLECGKEISKDLLDVVPESMLCKDCKKEEPLVTL